MSRHATKTVLLAAMILLAGCAGGIGDGGTAPTTADSTASPTASETDAADGGANDAETSDGRGRLNFYVSDEKNAISQFEHVNVTISRVGLHPVEGDGTTAAGNETTAGETNESDVGGWRTYDVDNRTVDLTKLQGANATKLASFEVEDGTYGKVFVYVSEINATLKDGSSQTVKLPSGRLQITERFTVGSGESVDFVFDVTVVEAGKSGKYVLKPVISESGTDVPIDPVGEAADGGEAGENAAALNASFVGNVTRGENATLSVTRGGSPVANATVAVDGERIGLTDANGTVTVSVPENATTLTVTVVSDGVEAELEVEFDDR
jgi:hypothetical protein